MTKPSMTFDSIGKYYDLLYLDKDYSKEVDYLLQLLNRLNFHGKDILEFGSGTGKHGRLLASTGLNILGIEVSASMLARSTDTDGFKAVIGDARYFDTGRKFDLVLSLFHVVSYQTHNIDIEAIFANASKQLHPAGLFIFDCWYSPAVHHQGTETRVKRMKEGNIEVTRIAEAEEFDVRNLVNVHYTVFLSNLESGLTSSFKELHTMRHFSIPELDRIASTAGFENVNAEAFLTGNRPDKSTWGVCLAYRKI